MAAGVAEEAARVATEPVELEVDLRSNRRGGRSAGVERLLSSLTDAEGSAVVNNGAAALWLAVRSLARSGRAVVVSRGEQVAIGGSFRMPELLRTTGAKMVEVGTTNRTSASDYARETREGDVVLKVHPSNYRIVGFHEEASLSELAEICRDRGAVLVFDAGSGSLYNFSRFGLRGEPTLAELLRSGADLVTCSADKLLGGPQAGMILGRGDLVDRCRRHPLMRAIGAVPDLPLFEALSAKPAELRRRAGRLIERCAPVLTDRLAARGWSAAIVRSTASMGAGSFANDELASVAVQITAPARSGAAALHRALRVDRPAVLARIDEDRVCLDMRAVSVEELEELGDGLARALERMSGGLGAREEE
jgi:L-seryl-tRNA(Ser) seleniumtransferase